MVVRTISQPRETWNSRNDDWSGTIFSKYQRGGDWSAPPKPVKLGDDQQFSDARAEVQRLRQVVRRLTDAKRVHWERNNAEKRIVAVALREARSALQSAEDILNTSIRAAKQRSAEYRERYLAGLRARLEENHDYYMNLSMTWRGVGTVTDSNGNVRWTEVSIAGIVGYSTPRLSWSDNDDIALVNKLMSNVSRGVDFQAAGALADVDRTVRMIGGSAKKLARSFKKAASGDLAGATRILVNTKNTSAPVGTTRKVDSTTLKWVSQGSSVRDRYLQYQFGIKPLIHDAEAAVRALAWLNNRTMYRKVSATRKIEDDFVEFRGRGTSCSVKSVIRARALAILKTDVPAADALGLLDLPSYLWERTLLSFVLDWWVPVGNYLQALQAARSLSSATVIKTTTERTTMSLVPDPRDGWNWTSNLPNTIEQVIQKRSCSTGVSVPLPGFKPLFHKDTEVSIRHTLESIALVHLYGEKLLRRYERDLRAEKRELRRVERASRMRRP